MCIMRPVLYRFAFFRRKAGKNKTRKATTRHQKNFQSVYFLVLQKPKKLRYEIFASGFHQNGNLFLNFNVQKSL